MLKPREYIGIVLFILGTVTMDSEWLIVPMALVGLGLWMMRGLIEC